MNLVSTVNQLLALATLFGHTAFILILFLNLFPKHNLSKKLNGVIFSHQLLFSLIISLAATLGSLFYSDIAGYDPCKLCWYQRIFMYPQPFLLWLAMRKKDLKILRYTVILSIFGALLSGYHYLLQLNFVPNLPCSAVGYSISCSQRFVMQFGYITIPLMAFTAFALLIILALMKKAR